MVKQKAKVEDVSTYENVYNSIYYKYPYENVHMIYI